MQLERDLKFNGNMNLVIMFGLQRINHNEKNTKILQARNVKIYENLDKSCQLFADISGQTNVKYITWLQILSNYKFNPDILRIQTKNNVKHQVGLFPRCLMILILYIRLSWTVRNAIEYTTQQFLLNLSNVYFVF